MTGRDVRDARRDVPRTDAVLADPRFAAARDRLGPALVKSVVLAAQERARRGEIPPEEVPGAALAALPAYAASLRPVINATGVVVHTNLGRAPLSDAARSALLSAAGATDVEFDLPTGTRAGRGRATLAALREAVSPAGDVAALVVNNGAAALSLAAAALGSGREVVVSRGELVEIGDGFRLPDLLVASGVRLREVGTTNRTAPGDYAEAIGPGTGFVLKVHPSNFVLSGFTAAVPVAELARLADEQGVPVVADLGSGLLAPHPLLPDEPDAATALHDGAAVVTASGDKLLGGPQAGIVLGWPTLVERMRRHPLARAFRVDKLTLAALEATLRGPRPPVRTALEVDPSELRRRAERLADLLAAAGVPASAVDSVAVVGGGGAPGVRLASTAVSLPADWGPTLRMGDPPVVGRLEKGRCLIDLRTVAPADDDRLAVAVRAARPDGSGRP